MKLGEPDWLLLVEDDADDEHLARRAFLASKRPEQLEVAQDGEEALKILKARRSPRLVLLDLRLPRLSGVEVLISIKDDERLRKIPVIIVTSSAELTDIAACYDLGCNAFIRKPVDYEQFMAAMSATFDFWLNVNIGIISKATGIPT
jgi:two-component system response regulator